MKRCSLVCASFSHDDFRLGHIERAVVGAFHETRHMAAPFIVEWQGLQPQTQYYKLAGVYARTTTSRSSRESARTQESVGTPLSFVFCAVSTFSPQAVSKFASIHTLLLNRC